MERQGDGGLIMEKLVKYIDENEVEYSTSLIKEKDIPDIEKRIGIKIGPCLKEYLIKYGYLIFSSIELYGITGHQGLDSDMIKQTEYLHKYYPKTIDLIAWENQGEGDYYLVNKKDHVFEYDSELDEMKDVGIGLEDYILQRFKDVE